MCYDKFPKSQVVKWMFHQHTFQLMSFSKLFCGDIQGSQPEIYKYPALKPHQQIPTNTNQVRNKSQLVSHLCDGKLSLVIFYRFLFILDLISIRKSISGKKHNTTQKANDKIENGQGQCYFFQQNGLTYIATNIPQYPTQGVLISDAIARQQIFSAPANTTVLFIRKTLKTTPVPNWRNTITRQKNQLTLWQGFFLKIASTRKQRQRKADIDELMIIYKMQPILRSVLDGAPGETGKAVSKFLQTFQTWIVKAKLHAWKARERITIVISTLLRYIALIEYIIRPHVFYFIYILMNTQKLNRELNEKHQRNLSTDIFESEAQNN